MVHSYSFEPLSILCPVAIPPTVVCSIFFVSHCLALAGFSNLFSGGVGIKSQNTKTSLTLAGDLRQVTYPLKAPVSSPVRLAQLLPRVSRAVRKPQDLMHPPGSI